MRLFDFLKSFDVGFESGAILVLRFEISLQFLDEELEAANFVAQFLEFGRGRHGARWGGGRWRDGSRCDG